MDRRARAYVRVTAAYLGAALVLGTCYHFNTEVTPAAVMCTAIPPGLNLLLGPLSLAECAFSNYRKLGIFLTVSAALLALFALITWTRHRWIRALLIAIALLVWFGTGLIGSFSLFGVLI